MISKKMLGYVQNSSAIRAMFEEGKKMAAIYGAENVFDFSLGNPNVPAPENVKNIITNIINEENSVVLHGYMSNSGYPDVREAIANSLNKRFKTKFHLNNILMTVGAAGGLNVILKTLLNPKDEVITFAPYFGEYRSYVDNYNGNLVVVPPNTATFQPDFEAFQKRINDKTKAIIINSPNNPTGVVYSEKTIKNLIAIINEKVKEFGKPIYLISDEPYRELVYDNVEVPYLTKYYDNTIVCYSYSKSLSLPGERIGYLVMPDELTDGNLIREGTNIANRILGFVNAPSLFQKVVAKSLEEEVNVSYYDRNRKLLYERLMEYGFHCVKPQGAFYLFMKSPIENDIEFSNAAKRQNILIVPGSSFGCPGFVRIAYCVSYETIENSLNGFKILAEEFI